LIDAISPPNGYRFSQGVVLTHDVTLSALNEILLPALAGLGTTDRDAGLTAPALLPAASLTVAAAGDRITADQFLQGRVVELVPVAGRRLHAKVLVLEYKRHDKNAGVATGGLLTVVTSANLTRAGLTRNREVYAVEWLPSNSSTASITMPVLQALRAFARALPPSDGATTLKRRVEALWRRRAVGSSGILGAVAHSLASEPQQGLPNQLLGSRVAPRNIERVVLIGPAFARNESDVAGELAGILAAGVPVDLVVDSSHSEEEIRFARGEVGVPTRLLSGLREAVGVDHVRVLASTSTQQGTDVRRRLHGKSIIVQVEGRALHLMGSVNITKRGLRGENRELVILYEDEVDSIDRALEEIRAVVVPGEQIVPVSEAPTLDLLVAPAALPLIAVFTPDPRQDARTALLAGTIRVMGRKTGTIRLPGGGTVTLVKGEARILLDPRNVQLTMVTGSGERGLVTLLEPADGMRFWMSTPSDAVVPTIDPFLRMLMRDYRRSQVAIAGTGRVPKPPTSGNDGFHVPADVRLNILARCPKFLRQQPAERLRELLSQYFPEPRERAAAEVVVLAATAASFDAASLSPLAAALASALIESDAGEQDCWPS
jgi:hypothetical protein